MLLNNLKKHGSYKKTCKTNKSILTSIPFLTARKLTLTIQNQTETGQINQIKSWKLMINIGRMQING